MLEATKEDKQLVKFYAPQQATANFLQAKTYFTSSIS